MSVTFSIGPRVGADLDYPDRWMNLSNRNAADLLAWLGLETIDLYGSISARELAARCRRRLWVEARKVDPAFRRRTSVGATALSSPSRTLIAATGGARPVLRRSSLVERGCN